jgi:hypothetical protein
MDALGIETLILSLNASAVQAVFEPVKAAQMAGASNDVLAEAMRGTRGSSDRHMALELRPDSMRCA